jgi:polyhydroxyalkanoate synthase
MMLAYDMAKRSNPLPADPLAQAFRAGQELYKAALLALTNERRRALDRPPVAYPATGTTPRTEQWKNGATRLFRYATASNCTGAPVLLVCSLINRPTVLDLLPDRSVVERLREAGRDVWLLDWGQAGPESASLGLHHFAVSLLPEAVAVVAQKTKASAVDVLGYCMGGTIALLAAGAGKIAPRSLIALATPVDLHDEGLLSLWSRTPGFDPESVVRVYGNAPPHLLQPAFKMLDPAGLASKFVTLDQKAGDDEFVRFFLAMESWLEDSVSFPGRAFIDWIKLYRDNPLPSGKATLDGTRIDLSRITCPVLTLWAEQDYITPPSSAKAIKKALPKAQHTEWPAKGGHIGLATGGWSQKTLWPKVGAWLAGQDNLMRAHQDLPRTHKKRVKR